MSSEFGICIQGFMIYVWISALMIYVLQADGCQHTFFLIYEMGIINRNQGWYQADKLYT